MAVEGYSRFHDSREVPSGTTLSCDVCVIGAGGAGITLARELATTKAEVVLLESGGLEYDDDIEALNTLKVTGHHYLEDGSRLRFFGGTTNHWGGQCVPLRPITFEKRDWIPHSGWPFGIEALHSYYARAHEVLEIGPYDYRPEPVAARLGYTLFPFAPETVETILSRYHAQRFGERYGHDLDAAANISVYLNATVTAINLDEDRGFVRDLAVKALAGNGFTVEPRYVVLAAGGIENARVLLLNDHQVEGGLGNQHDLVGRFFMDHIFYNSGLIVPADQDEAKVKLYAEEIPYEGDYAVRCHLAMPEDQVRALEIPGYRVELRVGHTHRWYPAVTSFMRMVDLAGQLDLDYVTATDILNVLSDPGSVLSYLMDSGDAPLIYGFGNYAEQVPNPDSRVRLIHDTDALGQRMTELDWRLSRLDEDGIRKAQHLIAREAGRTGVGRMKVFLPEAEDEVLPAARGGNHQMGTTRMHADPKQGVVDADCRLHGVENLYVAGSSVFPTSGWATPTLTIVALAIRLADHLKGRLARS
jgi:choline dehydrogenase-like flavoprotein